MMPCYGRNTIAAGTPPFFQQKFSEFVSSKRPLLIRDALDPWLLHRLQIEANQFHADGCDRRELSESVYPAHHVVYSTHEGRGQPALWPAAIIESGLAVSAVSTPAASAYRSAVVERLVDLLASVREFSRKKHLATPVVDKSYASGAAAGVELDAQGLYLWLLSTALEDDSKWVVLEHGSFPCLKQQTCTSWMHRVEWLLVRV